MNKLDELFKNKLENHSVPPREEAWNRIQINVEKKSNSVVWWYAAAALLVLSVGGWWAYTWKAGEVIENNNFANSTLKEKILPSAPKALAQLTETKQEKSHVTKTTTAQNQIPKIALAKVSPTAAQVTKDAPSIAKEAVADNQATAQSIAEVKEQEKIATPSPVDETETPIVLEYSLQPISSEVAATEQADKKNLKNVLMDLKNGETNINFQTIKENLLAFNQKKKPVESRE
jgi:hypothetical protein